jgi:hypothetical protein
MWNETDLGVDWRVEGDRVVIWVRDHWGGEEIPLTVGDLFAMLLTIDGTEAS